MGKNVAIVATGVGKTFPMGKQTVVALRDVSLSLPAGTLTALTGPSGSGKSTLLHLIAGLERVDSGTLEVLGHQVHACTPAQSAALRLREIGFVHQDFSLLADLTLLENVRLPLEATGAMPISLPTGPDRPDNRRDVSGAILSDPVDATTLTRASAYVTTDTARALGATTVDYSVIASPGNLAPDLEERLVEALEPVDVVMSDVRIETGPELTPPSLWYLLLGLTLAAVVTVLGITITSSATELRPDLVRLHRIGLSPGTLRRIVVWQSVTIAALAAVLGTAAGWGLTAARNWPGDIPVVMDWTAVSTVFALTLILGAAYGALAAPRRTGNTLNRTEA
jgi:ABC-type sugar transport system ATPase subunit